jgi:putative DNA primase/helicase
MRHLRDLASPVSAFIRDCCRLGPNHEVGKDDLWGAWKTWCEAEGMSPGTKAVLMRDLRAAHPEIKPKRARDGEERRQVAVGVGLRSTVGDASDHADQPASDAASEPDQAAHQEVRGPGRSGGSGVSPIAALTEEDQR